MESEASSDIDTRTGGSSQSPNARQHEDPVPASCTRIKRPAEGDEINVDHPFIKPPATRLISSQQLINEVKGIYAGLVMVEKKCVEIVTQQSQSTKRLECQQWKALVALHRKLLQEHHDFFSASQHPTASDALKRLATKYAMPARMWRHGIHAFLELLRHRLPDSQEHMLSFIYLSYSMMALLKETVPTLIDTWIECFGDLARYRMAIEESGSREREIWSNVARMWYNEAVDKSPSSGRIQHHFAIFARPVTAEQLFFYNRARIETESVLSTRESIMLLFDMLSKNTEQKQTRWCNTKPNPACAGTLPNLMSASQLPDFLLDELQSQTQLRARICASHAAPVSRHDCLQKNSFMRGHNMTPHYASRIPSNGPGNDRLPLASDRRQIPSQYFQIHHSFWPGLRSQVLKAWSKLYFYCGTRALFLLNVNRVLALPIRNITTPYPSRDHGASNNSKEVANAASLAIPLVLAPAIFLLGPKIAGIRDQVVTAALLCLMSTALIGVAVEAGLSIYLSRTCSGISLGSCIWVMRETRDKDEWPLLQLVRYMVMTVACHYFLQLLFLEKSQGELSDQFLSATIWHWSCLGSVSLNGLCNPMIERIKVWRRWLMQWRVEYRQP